MADSVNWDAIAAQVLANYQATGRWELPSSMTPVATTPSAGTGAPTTQTVGSGSDTLVLQLSEDAYQGDAQYTVSVDGTQVGGTFTAGALRSSGQHDTLTVMGDWAAGAHTVSVNFLNDAYAGTATTDRNLYVESVTYDGVTVSGAARSLMSAGPVSIGFTDTTALPAVAPVAPVTNTIGTGPDTLLLHISQDAYQGNAQYTVSVDGVQIGGVQTAAALHSSGQSDTLNVLGNWTAGAHTVSVNFLNDAYGGTASTDRNLYVDSATYDGVAVSGAKAALLSAGPGTFGITDTGGGTGQTGTGPDTLVVKLSEDAYLGNAQFTIKVDGVQIGGVMEASALHGSGQDDNVTLHGNWGAGNHVVTVSFLNDAYGAGGDRNLYLDGANYNGTDLVNVHATFTSAGDKLFNFYEKPAGADPNSYTVVMQDDFTHGYDSAKWGDPFPLPYPTGPSSNYAATFNPNAVVVQNGEIDVNTTRNADGSWTTGAFSSYRAAVGIQYGQVSFDAKVDPAQGTTFAFLLWPIADTWPPEIDVLETPQDRAMHTLHYGSTLADSSVKFGGPDPAAWHHYELTWLPNLVEIKTDGEVVASWDYNSPAVPMGFGILGFVGGQGDGWMGGPPDSTTPNVVTAHMANFVMSQWNGIA